MSYCTDLKIYQVINVLNDEYQRMKNHPEGDVHDGAAKLYQEAREELLRRGVEPDDELRQVDEDNEEEDEDEEFEGF